jgi:AP2 domain.
MRLEYPIDKLRAIFTVDEGGGLLRRGQPCGFLAQGYLWAKIGETRFAAHRIIFAIEYGWWPENVDHANGIKTDNRPSNLRAATHAQNMQNRGPLKAKTKGVYWQPRRGKWYAYTRIGGKQKNLGSFDTEAAAAAAYAAAAAMFHGEFARTCK